MHATMPVRFAECGAQTILLCRHHDKVNMIGHQTVRPHFGAGLLRELREAARRQAERIRRLNK